MSRKKIIIELRVQKSTNAAESLRLAAALNVAGLKIDQDYEPVPIKPAEEQFESLRLANEEIVLVRGEIDEENVEQLKSQDNVVKVWTDAIIRPVGQANIPPFPLDTRGGCTPRDCDPKTAKGNILDVARYLGCDKIWEKGFKGNDIVIAICDTGCDKNVLPVIDGWSPNLFFPPGTHLPIEGGWHGSMCGTDVIGMCPQAKLYDIGVLKSTAQDVSGFLSDAITGFQWAIDRFNRDGTPQIMSNSWGMPKEDFGPDYANDPNHPFTRKVVEAIDLGIIVTFAAGNCGAYCPSSVCETDTGPGRSIWGANGHPKAITIGAANIKEEWIGYSSQGPAALDPKKPDFCSISHFKGYTECDNGTSAANPICAGVIGLLKSAKPDLTQDEAKSVLQKTAKNICEEGWDANSGYGIIQAKKAFDFVKQEPAPPPTPTPEECHQCLLTTKTIPFYESQQILANTGISSGIYTDVDGYRYLNVFVEFEQEEATEAPVSLGIIFAFGTNGKYGSRRYFNFDENFSGDADPQMITLSGKNSWHGAQGKSSYTARIPVIGPFVQVFPFNHENKNRNVSVIAYLTT